MKHLVICGFWTLENTEGPASIFISLSTILEYLFKNGYIITMSSNRSDKEKVSGGAEQLDKFPEEGLIKTTDYPNQELSPAEKAQLNRKGNIFYNEGKIDLARRIFQTTGYSDGLIRIGEYYLNHEQPIEALKMFKLAHDDVRTETMAKVAAEAITTLLNREEDSNG